MPIGYDVIVCGSLHLDVMVAAPHLPSPDETTIGTDWGLKCGGKGGNQSIAAARAGARTAMIGRVGDDDFGKRLLTNLEENEVDRSMVTVDETRRSGMSVAIVEYSGEYGAVIVSGCNLVITPENIKASYAALSGAAVMVLQNEIPEAANLAAAQIAKGQGAIVLFNAAPMRPAPASLLKLVDILVLNRVEASVMAGFPVNNVPSAVRAVAALTADVPTVIVTLGGDGLVLGKRGNEIFHVPAQNVDIVSSHGAGDAFVGSLAAALARGETIETAAPIASGAAALFLTQQSITGE